MPKTNLITATALTLLAAMPAAQANAEKVPDTFPPFPPSPSGQGMRSAFANAGSRRAGCALRIHDASRTSCDPAEHARHIAAARAAWLSIKRDDLVRQLDEAEPSSTPSAGEEAP
jgi:hypothetical protein